MIVGVAPGVSGEEEVSAAAVGAVGSVWWQAGAGEGQRAAIQPFGEVVLVVKLIFGHVAGLAFGIGPGYIVEIGEGAGAVLDDFAIGVGLVVGDDVVVDGERVVILAAGELVPGVVGEAVAVGIEADHDDAGFGRAAFGVGIGVAELVEGVAPDAEVLFAGGV